MQAAAGGLALRPLGSGDYAAWLPLWTANTMGQCGAEVTAETWRRLNDPASGVRGIGAWRNGSMAGFVHYVLHPVTGHVRPACYMQDLFVAGTERRKGAGRALVAMLAALARSEGYARLYWLAETRNEAAQKLYEGIGLKLDFTFHILPL